MEITLYSTSTCHHCADEKRYLSERGLAYREVRVDQDHDGLLEMYRLSGQLGVPFTVVSKGDRVENLLGFDREALDKLIGAAA